MKDLIEIVQKSEEWLMERILYYAKRQNYTKYTSTFKEAWRMSILGLSKAIVDVLKYPESMLELTPDEDYLKDPIAAFGIMEANRHRERGIELSMFLGLYKYYKQTYEDLVKQSTLDEEEKEKSLTVIARVFDRIEIGFLTTWVSFNSDENFSELKKLNRNMVNEKNKFLTIIESISDPVILMTQDNKVEFLNHPAARLLGLPGSPGGSYYHRDKEKGPITLPDELAGKLEIFFNNNLSIQSINFVHSDGENEKHFQVQLTRMIDVSDKIKGVLLVFQDMTQLVKAEEAKRKTESLAKIKKLAGAVAHEISQPLQVLSNYFDLFQKGVFKKEYLNNAGEMVERIKEFTDDLCNITRLNNKDYVDTQILDIKASSNKQQLRNGDRILLVDDESFILETMMEMFQLKGYICDGAEDGIQAMELIRKNEYKMIISDVMMPRMSGPELFKKVKEENIQSIFIFITGYEMSKDLKETAETADGIFTKPINLDQFITQLENSKQD